MIGMECAACHVAGPPAHLDAHHIFPKQKNKWPELKDEPSNIITVCRDCHERHENASKRLPRSVCKYAESLPMTPAMESYLDRTYGPLDG